MANFDKNSDEYISNGHYNYGGKEWMSVWTFKKNNDGTTESTNEINGAEGKKLISNGVPYHISAPDFGSFREIFIYPITELEKFYNL